MPYETITSRQMLAEARQNRREAEELGLALRDDLAAFAAAARRLATTWAERYALDCTVPLSNDFLTAEAAIVRFETFAVQGAVDLLSRDGREAYDAAEDC